MSGQNTAKTLQISKPKLQVIKKQFKILLNSTKRKHIKKALF